ncbi:MAG: ABC transporter substrate-binding protein, partial [Treponema sp.]|nr:ABC transporter substrate-binding protein [Treponema sp.]
MIAFRKSCSVPRSPDRGRRAGAVLGILLVLPVLMACGNKAGKAGGAEARNGGPAGTAGTVAPAGDPPGGGPELYWTLGDGEGGAYIQDKEGFSVPLRAYSRIVLISPGAVETFYLIGAEDRIVAISSSRDPVWPEDKTVHLPSIGNVARPNMEAIVALEPDLIIGNAMSVSLAGDLAARG